jgi:hypothetical protein
LGAEAQHSEDVFADELRVKKEMNETARSIATVSSLSATTTQPIGYDKTHAQRTDHGDNPD